MSEKYAIKSDGFWKYRRRVPDEYAEFDSRPFVKISTKVRIADDPACVAAGFVIQRLNRETETFWAGLAAGKQEAALQTYKAAVKRARSRGFDYAPAAALSDPESTTLGALLTRIETLETSPKTTQRENEREAILGGANEPGLLISELVDWYEKNQQAVLTGYAKDQKRKWRNPKVRAVNNLLTVIDDKSVFSITRSDALEFRAWWQDRILAKSYNTETANKDFGRLSSMITALCQSEKRVMESPFKELRFPRSRISERKAFEPEFVTNEILGPGRLSELNDQARAVIYIMAETGCRVSEVCNPVFKLDHEVPHISVEPIERTTKTEQSIRQIPLVGIALKAAEAFPDGFPRYRHKADHLSNLVNKYFLNNGMRPTMHHTLYSLRHTFEDRLTAVEPPDKLIAALMGHKFFRPRYGSGPTLQQKKEWLEKIAYCATVEL